MKFSGRTPEDLSSNAIYQAIENQPRQDVLDLTESNPTHCGFQYPSDLLLPLSKVESLKYEPFPFGQPKARNEVAHYLRSIGWKVNSENIFLTSSTSEAYSFIFKLLADPGESFLVPNPGYPLLDHLVRLEGVQLGTYPLQKQLHWPVDMERAQKAFTANTKGLIVVNPTNPMGSFLNPKDQKLLFDLCLKNQTAYISDEVFSEYRYVKKDALPFEAPEHLLTFRLGGLSKSLGLPQLKLSWMVIDGPENLVEESRNRLELIMDSYLSVNSPVQEALKELFIFAPNFQSQVLTRILMNRTHLEETFQDLELVKVWPAQGGWYALVEVMGRKLSDEKLVLDLLKQKNMLVQPGGFYDFSDSCFLVISLMVKTDDFLEAVSRLKEYFESFLNRD